MKRALAATALLAVLAGCGGSPSETAAPTPAPSASAPPAVEPGRTPDEISCAGFADTAVTVKRIAEAMKAQPVLPAAVAVFLLDSRNRAATPGIQDPELAAAQAELLAAIDDVDAQGRALLPPGGNAAQNPVQLDPTRLLAAVEAVEPLCSTPL